MAVTTPFSTVATSSLLDFHVTFLFVALSGFTVATKVNFSSTFNVFSVWFRVTPVTAIILGSVFSSSTVIVHVAVLFPSTVVTVIVAVPSLFAVKFPFGSTVTTEGLLELQVTLETVALEGDTVEVSFTFSPIFISTLLLSNDTEFTWVSIDTSFDPYTLT